MDVISVYLLGELEEEAYCCELAPHIPEDSMDLYGPTWTLEVT
jgi:hypothetical protein